MTLTDDELAAIGRIVGDKYGYTDVQLGFTAFTEVKLRWQRSSRWIRIDIPDYFSDASAEAIESLLDNMLQALSGHGDMSVLPASVRAYLADPAFRIKWLPEYLRRATAQNESYGIHDAVPIWIYKMAAEHGVTPIMYKGKSIETSKIFRAVKIPVTATEEMDFTGVRIAILDAAMGVEVSA